MKTLEIGELESGLREYLATLLLDGEEVLLRDGDSEIARIVPAARHRESSAKGHPSPSRRGRPPVEPKTPTGKIDVETLLRYRRGNVSREAMMEALDWAKGDS